MVLDTDLQVSSYWYSYPTVLIETKYKDEWKVMRE